MDNKLLNKYSGYFKIEKYKQDSRVVIFLICLLIATVLWFLNALEKDYTTQIDYPVKYVNMPKQQFLVNDLPKHFTLKVDAHGFTLLRHKLHLSFTPIVLNVNNMVKSQKGQNNIYTINTISLANRISQQVSNEIKISEIYPSSFTIILDSMKTKLVPVAADIDLKFKQHNNLSSPISIEPKGVSIEGPGSILEKIDTIYTKKKIFEELDQMVEEELDLIEPDKTSLSVKRIKVKIPVSQFTEKVINSPIIIAGKPDSIKIKLFPSSLKVSFMVGLDKFSDIGESDFRFIVPYTDIIEGKPNVGVQVEKSPEYILDLKYTPVNLEYLIEKQKK